MPEPLPALPPALSPASVSMRRLAPMLLTGLFLLAIFIVPYRVPLLVPAPSPSWEFGFSNLAARLLIALLLLFLFACRLFLRQPEPPASPLNRALANPPPPHSPRPLLVTMAAFQVLACAFLSAWYRFLPFAHTGEMSYFVRRLDVMLLGRMPYRDFDFDYGPALIWLPILLYRLTHAALSVEAAYLLTLILYYLLGFSLIAYAIHQFTQVNSRSSAFLFVLLAIPFFNLDLGLNYAPLRFAIAPASILAIRHLYRALPRAPWRPLILALAAFLLPIVNCAISPEMGLAVIASLSVYFLWFLFGPRPHRHQRLAACNLLAVLAGALAVIAWFPAGYFDSIFSFSTGGLDFPLLPALHILTMLAAAIWILPRLGSSALRGPSSPSQPFHAAWAVLLGLLLVPATGRCDVSHVFFNSLPLFLLALSALTFLRRPWSHLLLAGYFFIFPLAGQIVFWENNLPTFRNILSYRRELSRSHYLSDNAPVPGGPAPLIHSSKLLPADPWLRDLPHVPIGLPLGADEMTERYLLLASRSLPEHFIPPHTIYSPAQLERKFADLQAMPYVYVPLPCLTYLKPLDLAALAARARDDDAFLSRLLLFPANLPPVNPVFDPDAAVMRRIVRDYRVLRQFPSGYLLVRHE